MSKIIVYHDGPAVTGYSVVEPNHLEAARIGLTGADAVTFDRAVKQLGVDVVATLTKTCPRKTADEALATIAAEDGRAFLLVDRLPPTGARPDGRDDVDLEQLKVEGGKVVAA